MKKHKCPKCGIKKQVSEDYWYRNQAKKSGFDLSTCRECKSKYHKERLHRITKKPHKEPTLTPFEMSCIESQVKRATESVPSVYQEAF